ncbi:MAG: glycosyltransferase family 2 protein [Candidatus Poseidoniaceae archaeon]|nr:glycosyltransferase family 2 protein [Candidatus Poseidoniaceae archaeon]
MNCVKQDNVGDRMMSNAEIGESMRSVTLLLPALDEEGALPQLLAEIPINRMNAYGWDCHILLVDGGSKDATVQIATDYGCEIIHQGDKKGKGLGMRVAFEHFIDSQSQALVMIDADGTYDPKDIPSMLAALEDNDIVVGSRLQGEIDIGAMTRINYLGNCFLSWFASVLYGEFSSDLCSGAWAFRRSAIERMDLNSVHFEIEAEMFATCAMANFAIGFVPISYRCRTGLQKLGSFRDGISILRKLIVRRVFRIAGSD